MTEQSPEPVEAPDTAPEPAPVDEAAPDPGPEPGTDPGDAVADPGEHHDGPSLGPDGQVRTGNVTVDTVLASLEGLEDRPVAEHVEVFEHAHEQLRRALDDAGDPAEPADR